MYLDYPWTDTLVDNLKTYLYLPHGFPDYIYSPAPTKLLGTQCLSDLSLSCVVCAPNYEAVFSNVSIVKFQIDFSYLMPGNFVVTFSYDSAHQLVCFVPLLLKVM